MILMQLFLFNMFNLDGFEQNKEIILSQGFSLEGLIRGLIGMSVLILIAFLLSNNRKAINWKTASFGLVLQIILAIAVLKISWVKMIFEFAGKVFVKILDFTMEGTQFLFGDLVSVENFGNVFIFSILPTVIFFAALTSILFYFGIIQKVVKV
ncbi:MAG: Na+ dependent nucleoside transporter, partial [Flavobacteriaceae bacterium]|nr:Na+ dependent nucleoside transporter [Flavobacteriaceae bacterium]